MIFCKNSIQKAVTSVTLINTESHHSGWNLSYKTDRRMSGMRVMRWSLSVLTVSTQAMEDTHR